MDNVTRILLLEEDITDLEVIERMLRFNLPAVTLTRCSTASGFEKMVMDFQPDCILADNSVWHMDASEALAKARALLPQVAFIVVTGSVPENYAIDMLTAGADDYILKDRLKRLPAAVANAVRKHRLLAAEAEAVQKLRENEEKYRTLIERVSDGFIALDKEFCYTYVNPQTAALVQKAPSELLGKNVWEVFPQAVGSVTYHSFVKAMKEQVYVSSTDYYAPLDLWQENHIYPSPEGLSVFIRDISERKRAELQQEEQLRMIAQQNDQLKEIAWMQSHTIRNHVANIMGLAALVDQDKCTDPETAGLLRALHRSAEKLDEVIREISGMAKSS